MALVRIAFALALAVPATAIAAPPRSYAIEVAPASDWRAEALGPTLAHDLADDRLVLAAKPATAELVVDVRLDEHILRYELHATWPGAPAPVTGMVQLGALDRAGLAGQLRDQLHRLARTTRDDRADVAIASPSLIEVAAMLALALALVAIPFAIGVVRRRRLLAVPALRHAIGVVLALGVAGAGLVWLDASTAWLFAGGLAWGAVVVVTVPIVLPPLVGFSRVEYDELWRVIGVWLVATGRRALAVTLLYAPFAIATALATGGAVLGLALAVPLVLLAVRLAVRCAVAVAAAVLDDALLARSPTADAWEAATRAYVVGYMRRAGLPMDVELLRRVRLVPAICDDVAVYGGGLTASRIAIPQRMLELALAPAGRPHDYAAPRVSVLHWAQWNAGLVMPTGLDDVVSTTEQRRPREVTVEGESPRELLGQLPTLAGVVEPSELDIDHKSYRPHDDPMWLDWDPGEDYDGTDAGDRDFLFGAVVHALGEIQRHGDRLATFVLLLRGRARRFADRAPAIGDHHAALAGARHHLAQFLAWRLWHRDDQLTARAYPPELEAASRHVLAALSTAPDGDPRLRRRLARLCDPVRVTRWQRLVLAGAVITAVGVASLAIVNAVRYTSKEIPIHGKD
jgi:hypothetical protein